MSYTDEESLYLRTCGPTAVHKMLEAVLAASEQGYILDPKGRPSFLATMLNPFECTIRLVKQTEALKEELTGKTPEELVQIIDQDLAKERLLEIAALLEITIPEDKKVPKAISKFMKDAVIERGGEGVE